MLSSSSKSHNEAGGKPCYSKLAALVQPLVKRACGGSSTVCNGYRFVEAHLDRVHLAYIHASTPPPTLMAKY